MSTNNQKLFLFSTDFGSLKVRKYLNGSPKHERFHRMFHTSFCCKFLDIRTTTLLLVYSKSISNDIAIQCICQISKTVVDILTLH